MVRRTLSLTLFCTMTMVGGSGLCLKPVPYAMTLCACVCVCVRMYQNAKKDDGMLLKVPQLGEGLS